MMKATEPDRHAPETKADTRIGSSIMQGLIPIQGRMSLIPNDPFLERELFPFLDPLEENYKVILEELQELLKYRDEIPGFEEVSPDQGRIAKNKQWKTLFLYGFGQRVERNCELAPKTAALLEQVPKLRLAMFSIIEPRYHIPAHVGIGKGFLRCQLGLVVPKDTNGCRMRVADQIQTWKPGELFVFDDTYDHEVWNDTDEERIVLLFDFDRPMRWPGRFINWLMLTLVRLTSFYKVPKKNMDTFGSRFEERIKAAEKALEGGRS
ncbi:aspartyl/asparaginyl beta-hydroxylase domain-containing protein [Shimia abyssi]|uniref:Beta-hydroxylase n=1 Tax=Shimia abyssi TaxID=1662395 RepID=A0A2P8FFQ8_9RHOB|nr:aspartyl/asparaginyl beta-hydroxylase domain-containing protein [Shimia abyssi]PSL20541.1 beta-hydroxylase [Shimia abyssi]